VSRGCRTAGGSQIPEEKKRRKMTLGKLCGMKRRNEPITWLTCYDYPMAQIMDASGMDTMLVGDSGAMTVLGYPTTLPQTLDAQLMVTEAVLRGTSYAFVVGDMSYMTYEMSKKELGKLGIDVD
jgi:3-methyl-2-oxobutanoate hydroxymethyltransferase